MNKKYKVLHAPTSTGGNPQGLSRALQRLDVVSESWIYRQNVFNYKADRVIWQASYGLLRREFFRFAAIVKAIFYFDVVHYNAGSTLAGACPLPFHQSQKLIIKILRGMQYWYLYMLFKIELRTLRVFNKPIFVHFQGDDVRQGDFLLNYYDKSVADVVNNDYYYCESDCFKRKIIREFDCVVDQIYVLNPDLMRVLPSRSKFQAYGHVFLDEWTPVYNQLEIDRPLRIGHAPSNRTVKGTDLIINALDQLRFEGFEFELVLVEGVSQQEAREKYEYVDILVDQLHYGWYGGLAVEAMSLGKPVVVFIREEDLEFIPDKMREDLPFIRTTSETIKEVLREVLNLPKLELFRLAKKSREFVERWHDPIKIAAEIKQDYENAISIRVRL